MAIQAAKQPRQLEELERLAAFQSHLMTQFSTGHPSVDFALYSYCTNVQQRKRPLMEAASDQILRRGQPQPFLEQIHHSEQWRHRIIACFIGKSAEHISHSKSQESLKDHGQLQTLVGWKHKPNLSVRFCRQPLPTRTDLHLRQNVRTGSIARY